MDTEPKGALWSEPNGVGGVTRVSLAAALNLPRDEPEIEAVFDAIEKLILGLRRDPTTIHILVGDLLNAYRAVNPDAFAEPPEQEPAK